MGAMHYRILKCAGRQRDFSELMYYAHTHTATPPAAPKLRSPCLRNNPLTQLSGSGLRQHCSAMYPAQLTRLLVLVVLGAGAPAVGPPDAVAAPPALASRHPATTANASAYALAVACATAVLTAWALACDAALPLEHDCADADAVAWPMLRARLSADAAPLAAAPLGQHWAPAMAEALALGCVGCRVGRSLTDCARAQLSHSSGDGGRCRRCIGTRRATSTGLGLGQCRSHGRCHRYVWKDVCTALLPGPPSYTTLRSGCGCSLCSSARVTPCADVSHCLGHCGRRGNGCIVDGLAARTRDRHRLCSVCALHALHHPRQSYGCSSVPAR